MSASWSATHLQINYVQVGTYVSQQWRKLIKTESTGDGYCNGYVTYRHTKVHSAPTMSSWSRTGVVVEGRQMSVSYCISFSQQ